MKGELHERLRRTLKRATDDKVCTQDSIAEALHKSQRSIGQYLSDDAGALDLDEAVAALEHIGSTLPDFIAGLPPRTMSRTERLARALVTRPELADLVEDLLPVQQKKLSDVIELARGIGRVARTRPAEQKSESNSARRLAPRTRSEPTRRR